jgi:hypothetical protein
VSRSNGTIEFLRILRYLLDAFTLPNLTPAERIYKAFYSLFMLRIWRIWCIKSKDANLGNFITYEAFVAIEINCWSLIKLIRLCRNTYGEKAFQIHLFNSQNCEKFFGLLRSLTSTFFTMINFTSLEILQKIQKVHILNKIEFDLGKKGFDFPHKRSSSNSSVQSNSNSNQSLPDETEIYKFINKAFQDAKTAATGLGIVTSETPKFERNLYASIYMPQCDNEDSLVKMEDSNQVWNMNEPYFLFQNLKFINEENGRFSHLNSYNLKFKNIFFYRIF